MSEWAPKRFYEEATVASEGEGFGVRLDGRPVRTPGKRPLVVPTAKMAERIVSEWLAQEKSIDPRSMPWTRSANTALDKVAVQRREIMDHLLGYAGTDLLYYRAHGPDTLTARQSEFWDRLLDWASSRYDLRFQTVVGVMPVSQDDAVAPRLRAAMEQLSDFQLTGFYDLVALSGSFLIALAAVEDFARIEWLWQASRVDEHWQAEQWGEDEESQEVEQLKRAAFFHAMEFLRLA
jgi:chaperone required for assembly of F1-ATPase